MTHGSLFSGIGMFDLAAEWMGWENVFNCDKDERCRNVLKKHWNNVTQYEDIKTTDFTIWRGLDVITGGDPCQPSSLAGLRKGMSDERYLWPEMFRAIREIRPRWVVNENVPGTINNGVLDQKITDLQSEGYTCWPPLLIPASAVGAHHKRNRVWLVAYSERVQQPREKPCSGKVRRMGREFKPVSWDRTWGSALCEFRGMDDGRSYRVDRLDGIRNAVVPQLVFEIFKAIEANQNNNV
jgi:DNA (cytosine-5)-methyltransferase 1